MIDPELREQLDDIQVSKLAEYLGRRLGLDEGDTMLQLEFTDGRYQRMRRYDKPRGSSLPSRMPRLGRSGA
jgi:hypothetical protein